MVSDTMPLVLRQFLIWTTIVGLSAAPSFVIAAMEYPQPSQILAMLAGIGCFILGYTAVSCTEWAQRFKRRPFVLDTMKVGYGTRLFLSGVTLGFPIGAFPDLYLGLASIAIVTDVLQIPEGTTFMVFLTTIVEGALWNIALAVYMLVIYGVQRLFRKPPPLANVCVNCGYDLRASRDVCPECGTKIVSQEFGRIENVSV